DIADLLPAALLLDPTDMSSDSAAVAATAQIRSGRPEGRPR
ncbi:MAG: hypothetical protein QOG08_291, partial [Chloroflexota bacterium]|nr:hypothetical protein [Chloroflexota bacterium]